MGIGAQGMTRRGFVASSGVAMVVGGIAAAGAGSVAIADAALIEGVYTGSADGMASAVTVTITVDGSGTITEVEVNASGETAGIGAAAQDTLRDQLSAALCSDIDGVAGATITSNAAKKAMDKALEQAATGVAAEAASQEASVSKNPAWLGEKPAICDADCKETIDCELLIAGAGTAGLFAAMSAAESGAKPLVIEKTETGMGVRYQMGAVNTKLQQSAGVVVDRNEITEEFGRYSNYWNDPKLVHLWYDKSGEIFDFYNDLCRNDGLDPHLMYFSHNEAANYGGFITCNEVLGDKAEADPAHTIKCYVEQAGGTFRYSTSLVELIQDEAGKVIGAYAVTADGDYVRINAEKGVILATGGYARNDEMMQALQPHTCLCYASASAPMADQGDGIKAAMWAGAVKDEKTSSMLFERTMLPIGTTDVKQALANGTGKFTLAACQPWLTVDLDGERFCNESGPYDYRLHSISGKGGVMVVIIPGDPESFVAHNYAYDTDGCARIVPMPLWDGEKEYLSNNGDDSNVWATAEEYVNGDPTYFAVGETVEELAEKLGLPVENLVNTVNCYNGFCETGVDEDFGKEAFRLMPYDKGPFIGMYITGRILCTFDGIIVNAKLQALDARGKAIEGLYCVGNDSGRYFCDSYPNITAGASGGRCAVFGWLASKVALGEEI